MAFAKIELKGTGSREQIIKSLTEIVEALKELPKETFPDRLRLEDDFVKCIYEEVTELQ